ncbi:MAG: hypothetical protein GW886_10675, partial [Rhodobacterales bacterium]|nr:hypothetical protein [Rhodobacterales bacterium]
MHVVEGLFCRGEIMDFSASSMAGTMAHPAPRPMPDQRPTADAAALNRSKEPLLPVAAGLPAPPSTTQAGAVSSALLAGSGVSEADAASALPPVEQTARTLKPYGITMLPDDDRKARQQTEDSAQDTAQDT